MPPETFHPEYTRGKQESIWGERFHRAKAVDTPVLLLALEKNQKANAPCTAISRYGALTNFSALETSHMERSWLKASAPENMNS